VRLTLTLTLTLTHTHTQRKNNFLALAGAKGTARPNQYLVRVTHPVPKGLADKLKKMSKGRVRPTPHTLNPNP